MKFAIILLSCLFLVNCAQHQQVEDETLAEGFRWGRHWDSNRRFECQYVPELQVISCFRGLVECETIPRFEGLSESYQVYAISSDDMVNFFLYPRNFTDLLHADYKVQTSSNGLVEMRLFSSEQVERSNYRGFMVRDAVCFRKIVDLIRVINNPVIVELSNKKKVQVLSYVVNLAGDLEQHSTHQVATEDRFEVTPFGKSLERNSVLNREFSMESRWKLEDSTRRFECKYIAGSELLSCFRGLVKCETVSRLEEVKQRFEVFGLGSTDMTTYHLYPRNLNETRYSDYRVPATSGRTVELSLLRSGMEGYGLVVRDAVCYQRIVDFLRVVNQPTMVDVHGDNTDVKVAMMGYVINTISPIY